MENRHGESGRFSGAGLRAAQNIPAGEDQRNRLGLNRRGERVTLGPDGLEDWRRQLEI